MGSVKDAFAYGIILKVSVFQENIERGSS